MRVECLRDFAEYCTVDEIFTGTRCIVTSEFFFSKFRYLSHRFHGKGSGKIKTEKRMKKIMEEGAMKNMSSTDTPLNTLQKLKARQSETATPYLILTGNKSNPATDITDIRK